MTDRPLYKDAAAPIERRIDDPLTTSFTVSA
jgi:hypothetical protein